MNKIIECPYCKVRFEIKSSLFKRLPGECPACTSDVDKWIKVKPAVGAINVVKNPIKRELPTHTFVCARCEQRYQGLTSPPNICNRCNGTEWGLLQFGSDWYKPLNGKVFHETEDVLPVYKPSNVMSIAPPVKIDNKGERKYRKKT